ncbi:MAG TPA: O-antigen ligase family protein [Terriglobia bacterium]|nr:O-antigen ligase family protein [Terriglobia bacterium]
MSSVIVNPTVAALYFEAERAEVRSDRKVITAGRMLLAASLLLAPLAFGAVEPWAWGALAAVAAILLWLWVGASAGQSILRVTWSPLYLPAAAFFFFALIQLPGQSIRDAAGTREPLLKLATDMLFFFVALQFWVAASGRTWRKLGFAVSALAFSLSVLAILQFFSNPNLIYWCVKPRWGGWIFGPYVNHNHYAGLMEMLIPVATGFLLSLDRHSPGRALLGFAVLVPMASVLLSGSRGGFIALLAESLVFFTVLLRFGPAIGRRFLAAGLGLGVTIAALIFFWMDPGAVAGHLATVFERQPAPQIEAGFEARLTLSEDVLHMFRDHPWFGTGLGSFEAVYPQYQSFPSDKLWEHAHDDYAEALAETGLVGGALIAGAVILFLRLAFRNLARRLSEPAGWIRLGAAIGCCGLLVHSLFDFNLHIPANAAWFAACAAWATCGPPSHPSLGGERS